MKNFKLKQGNNRVYQISKSVYDEATQKRPLYYDMENDKCYAICPQCDNPIQLIGLYKQIKVSPYGKHYPHSIPLAAYNQQAYEYCPYHNKHYVFDKNVRKRQLTEFEKNIYVTARENFDSAIYILSQQLNIKVTMRMAEDILRSYTVHEAWMYPWATLNNIPWMLGYFLPARSLYKQLIKTDSELYQAIQNNCPKAEFDQSQYYKDYSVLNKTGWPGIMSTMILHNREVVDDTVKETIVHNVFWDNDNNQSIYRKELEIDEKYFLNLINSEKRYRNEQLLELAHICMPDL